MITNFKGLVFLCPRMKKWLATTKKLFSFEPFGKQKVKKTPCGHQVMSHKGCGEKTLQGGYQNFPTEFDEKMHSNH